MLSDSQFKQCGGLNETQLRVLNLTMCLAGGVGTLITLAVITALVCVQAYRTVLQRLFLYSVLATLVHELLHVSQIEVQFQFKWQDQVCTHLGFLSNWSGIVIYIFNLDIILYLLFVVYRQLRGGVLSKYFQSHLCRGLAECLCVLLSIFLPVAYIWVPYKENNYGLNEAYCYIKAFDNNCTTIGVKDKLIYAYSLYEGVGIVAVVIAAGILIVYCTLSVLFIRAKNLLRQILILLLAILLYIVILNVMIAVDVLVDTPYPLNIFFAIAATLTDLIFMFGYLLAFYSSQFKRCLMLQRRKRPLPRFFNDNTDSKEYGTFEDSIRSTRPSYTYFDVPYTGEFTSVPSNIN